MSRWVLLYPRPARACVRYPARAVGIVWNYVFCTGKCLSTEPRIGMAAARLGTQSWIHRANLFSIVGSRSYAAMAIKNKQKPSGSQTPPTPRSASPSPTAEPQPSGGKAKKSKSKSSSLESAAEQNLQAMESMKRFSKMYATADVWGTEMTNLGMTVVPGPMC